MEDIIIIPNRIWTNAPEDLAEKSRNRSLTTQKWGAKGGFSLHLLPHPLLSPPTSSVRSSCSPPLPYKELLAGKSVFAHPGEERQFPVSASFPILATRGRNDSILAP